MTDQTLVPKILHFLWLPDMGDMPRRERENVQAWIDMNDDYGVMLWDHDKVLQFLYRFFPKYAQIWLGLRGGDSDKRGIVKQLDMARYLIMHVYGGCYFDNDTTPLRPLREFWANDRVVGRTLREVDRVPEGAQVEVVDFSHYDFILSADNYGVRSTMSTVTNCQIFSVPGLRFWLEVVGRGINQKDDPVLTSFGTWTLTDCLREKMISRDPVNALVMPPFYFNWVPRVMKGTPPPFCFCEHENKISWGDRTLEQPWRA